MLKTFIGRSPDSQQLRRWRTTAIMATATVVIPPFEACGSNEDQVETCGLRVRVVSWNILADRCLRNHPYASYSPDERRQLQKQVPYWGI